MAENRYTLASSEAERARLARQALKLRPMTERLFRASGIGPGMRVLDIGSGAGDVSALAAELVGPDGLVVGCDQDPNQVASAAARFKGTPSLRFEVADINDPPLGPYDAIVGRLVLMYQADMTATIARLARTLAPSGVVAFVELSINLEVEQPSWPPPGPLAARVGELIRTAFVATNVQPFAGLRLPSVMRAAGLQPQTPYETGSILNEGREANEMQVAIFRSMIPVLEAQGVDLDGLRGDDLAQRLEDEQHDEVRVIAIGPLLGVWARFDERDH
jgi:SAM-dependent methyltransferase